MLAFRTWQVSADGLLRSMHLPSSWPAGEAIRASCLVDRRAVHDPPEQSCTCGVYGFASAHRVAAYAVAHAAPVAGSVRLFAPVLEIEAAWRGAAAYPQRLVLVRDFWEPRERGAIAERAARALEARYGIPVCVVPSFADLHYALETGDVARPERLRPRPAAEFPSLPLQVGASAAAGLWPLS